MLEHPNVVFILSDQHRAQAVGYAGNPGVHTPNFDALKQESISLTTAVSTIPVCTPMRACLLTGQYPLTHGIFLNDIYLRPTAVSMAKAFAEGGYNTAYIGKWHIDGHGRSGYIPPERRLGFDFWRVLECTHSYNDSKYYADDEKEPRKWAGYDAEAQTECAIDYIQNRDSEKPFMMVLAWGPPHAPYSGAPEKFTSMYDPASILLRPNVPAESAEQAREEIAGYYAHTSAIDEYTRRIMDTLDAQGIADNTILIYTSDHGDMLGSQGKVKKQQPWDESILVPFLIRYPALLGREGREVPTPIGTPDIMPTLLEMAGLPIPHTVEGYSYADFLTGSGAAPADAALIQCVSPFGQWSQKYGGKEYRGIRTERYTYARDLDGPWILFDNKTDPYQQDNLINEPSVRELQARLENTLSEMLADRHDHFLDGATYVKIWDYPVGENGTVPWEW